VKQVNKSLLTRSGRFTERNVIHRGISLCK